MKEFLSTKDLFWSKLASIVNGESKTPERRVLHLFGVDSTTEVSPSPQLASPSEIDNLRFLEATSAAALETFGALAPELVQNNSFENISNLLPAAGG